MAEAIREAIDQGDSLICEAGTGTGKTFAYLVPALQSGLQGGYLHRHPAFAGPTVYPGSAPGAKSRRAAAERCVAEGTGQLPVPASPGPGGDSTRAAWTGRRSSYLADIRAWSQQHRQRRPG